MRSLGEPCITWLMGGLIHTINRNVTQSRNDRKKGVRITVEFSLPLISIE